MGHTIAPVMDNQGVFPGATQGERVPHRMDHGAVHESIVCTVIRSMGFT